MGVRGRGGQIRWPSCDSEAVVTVSERAGGKWGCFGDGRRRGSLWGWRDCGYLPGKQEEPPAVEVGTHLVSEG